MKRYLFSILCCAILNLEAASDYKISITPTQTVNSSGKKEYLGEIEFEHLLSMRFTCYEGEKSEMELESADKTTLFITTILIPENNPTNEATTLVQCIKDGKTVFSIEDAIKINAAVKARSWAERRHQLLKTINKD